MNPLNYSLPAPDYKRTVNITGALNKDIISVLHQNFPVAVEQTKEFSKQFQTDSRLHSALKIWKFLKQKIKYVKDQDHSQDIRLPSRFISDGEGDCKTYSLFTAAILANLGYPVIFRYASYNNSPVPTHVYVVTTDKIGNEIIIDAVYNKFNSQANYKHKKDYVMNVSTLSGIGQPSRPYRGRMGWTNRLLASRAKHAPGTLAYQLFTEAIARQTGKSIPFTGYSSAQIEQLKTLFATLKLKYPNSLLLKLVRHKISQVAGGGTDNVRQVSGIGKKKKGFFKKVFGKGEYKGKLIHLANLPALAPARTALISLIAMNFRGLAGKFAYALAHNNKKLKQRWYTMGGNPKKLVSYINKGKKKKPFLGGKKTSDSLKKTNLSGLYEQVEINGIYDEEVTLGVAPAVAAPAWLALAGSLIAVLGKLWKGKKTEPGESSTASLLSEAGVTVESTRQAVENIISPPDSAQRTLQTEDTTDPATAHIKPGEGKDLEDFNESKSGFSPSPLLLGAAAIAAILLLKK